MVMYGVHMLMGLVLSQPDINRDYVQTTYTHTETHTWFRPAENAAIATLQPRLTSISRLQAATPCKHVRNKDKQLMITDSLAKDVMQHMPTINKTSGWLLPCCLWCSCLLFIRTGINIWASLPRRWQLECTPWQCIPFIGWLTTVACMLEGQCLPRARQ